MTSQGVSRSLKEMTRKSPDSGEPRTDAAAVAAVTPGMILTSNPGASRWASSSTMLAMDHLGGKKLVGEKMWAAFSKKTEAELFKDAWRIEDIPAECLSHKEGIYLMQIGKIKHFGEGCACPMGGLSREFLGHLVLGPKDVVIIDTEAGVEHLGRGVEKSVDLILVVLDPSYESIRLSEKISDMAKEGNKPVFFILNKVDERSAEILRSKVGTERIAATVPFDAGLMEHGLSGQELDAEVQGIDKIVDLVQTAIPGN